MWQGWQEWVENVGTITIIVCGSLLLWLGITAPDKLLQLGGSSPVSRVGSAAVAIGVLGSVAAVWTFVQSEEISLRVLKLLISFAVLWLFGMLLLDDLRGSAVTNAWSLIGAGTAVWYLYERKSSPMQRLAWLREHVIELAPVLQAIRFSTITVAQVMVSLPLEVENGLWLADTRAAHRKAAIHARQLAWELLQGGDTVPLEARLEELRWVRYAVSQLEQVLQRFIVV
jgi:hypothetical protein